MTTARAFSVSMLSTLFKYAATLSASKSMLLEMLLGRVLKAVVQSLPTPRLRETAVTA
jgi:hypothetical protein